MLIIPLSTNYLKICCTIVTINYMYKISEQALLAYENKKTIPNLVLFNARDVGIEPTSFLLERKMLPLHQSRIINFFYKSIYNNKNLFENFTITISDSNATFIPRFLINASM